MNSETLSKTKAKLKRYLKDDKILDIVLFGSSAKGKVIPEDIDIAIITNEKIEADIPGLHISIVSPNDFFINPPTIINTILREGYSLKNNKAFSELYKFKSKTLYSYELTGLTASSKVRAVNILRGTKDTAGIISEKKGEWLANCVFIAPVESDSIIEKLLTNLKIKFRKQHALIH